jgi:hypothetical protein
MGSGVNEPPQNFDGLSVKQLKEHLRERSISTSGMTERSEFVAALAQAGGADGGGGGGSGGGVGGGGGGQAPQDESQPPAVAHIPTGMDSRVTCWECASCGKAQSSKNAMGCGSCRKVVYCNLACATAHFKEHMEACFLAVCARVNAGDVHKDDTGGEYVLKQYIKRARRSFGDQDVRTVEAIDRYATFLQYIGRLKEAEPLFREALAGRRATLGPKHPDTLISMSNLAQLLQDQGKLGEAEGNSGGQTRHPWSQAPRNTNQHEQLGCVAEGSGQAGRGRAIVQEDTGGQARHPWSQTPTHTYQHEQLGCAAEGTGQAGRGRAIAKGDAGGLSHHPWSQAPTHTYQHEQLGCAAEGTGQAGRGGANDEGNSGGQARHPWSQAPRNTNQHEQLGFAAEGSGQAGRGRAIV